MTIFQRTKKIYLNFDILWDIFLRKWPNNTSWCKVSSVVTNRATEMRQTERRRRHQLSDKVMISFLKGEGTRGDGGWGMTKNRGNRCDKSWGMTRNRFCGDWKRGLWCRRRFWFLEKNDLVLSKCDESGGKTKVLAECFASKVIFSTIVMIFELALTEIITQH